MGVWNNSEKVWKSKLAPQIGQKWTFETIPLILSNLFKLWLQILTVKYWLYKSTILDDYHKYLYKKKSENQFIELLYVYWITERILKVSQKFRSDTHLKTVWMQSISFLLVKLFLKNFFQFSSNESKTLECFQIFELSIPFTIY